MKLEFFEKDAPKTVANFTKLAKDGYYDGLKWHRVLPDFVIQGGCPNSKDGASGMAGTGGPGSGLTFNIGPLTSTTTYHVYAEKLAESQQKSKLFVTVRVSLLLDCDKISRVGHLWIQQF